MLPVPAGFQATARSANTRRKYGAWNSARFVLVPRRRKEQEMATRVLTPEIPKPLTARKAWKALEAHHKKLQKEHLRTLFAKDPNRGQRLAAEGAGIFFDYSKNRITDETL